MTQLERASRALGLDSSVLELDEALRLLERITAEEGMVGIVARFTKARLLLRSTPAPRQP
jgi:hypothetical protein